MDFYEVLDQVVALLRQRGRLTYRALKYQFQLDDDGLEALKEELIEAQRLAADDNGKVLMWIGASLVPGSTFQVSGSQPPTPSTQPPDAGRQTLDSARPEAERRQLTVMFCDLVGSTALSAQLDPEELREVVRAYQETCTTVIRRYDGHIAQHLGDGLLVYFGYPAAHEDDAQRAVRAGLEIVVALQHHPSAGHEVPSPLAGEGQGEGAKISSVATLTPHPNLPPQGGKELRRLQVRIGIHTGLVVVGEIGSSEKREILALGETPNLAARLQGLAAPDTVVISGTTSQLVQGLFDCHDLGPHEVKGISTPLLVYRVLGESDTRSRFEVAVRTGLTPLVGRDEELGLLRKRWEQVKEGQGHVVLLSGEPGIGKSRLVQVLKEQAAQERMTRIEFHCSPFYQNTAFYPVIEHLQRLLQWQPEATPQAKLEQLQTVLRRYRFPQADTVPLLAALLSLPHPDGSPLITVSPQKQKEKTQAALVAWLVEEAEKAAVYCTWEDLHWADPSTLEVLNLVVDQVPTARLYVLLTFRPEFTQPWGNRSHLSQLTLSRLGRPQVEAMVEKVTGGKALPPEVVQQIVAKTDGVPLFVEELTKMVLESGLLKEAGGYYELTGPLPTLAIPTTLQDSLMARLDRLATVKEVAQLGATLGREFPYELMQAVAPMNEASLQEALAKLVEAEVLYQRGLPPQARYVFKHALIQDAAYQSLLKSKRQQYHQQIAQVLEARFPETKEAQPELLARHYTEAGLIAQAIPYWQRAGQIATQRSANVEAISHLTQGLELLKILPDSPQRTEQELRLQLTLGPSLMATRGFGAPEVEKAYTRARELSQQIGETPLLFQALLGLGALYHDRAELKTARELGEQLLCLAPSMRSNLALLGAHLALGATLRGMGDLTSARGHLEQSLVLYEPQQHRVLRHSFAEPRVIGLSQLAHALWLLGYSDQALRRVYEALSLARELSHPFSLAYALSFAAEIHRLRQEQHAAQELEEARMTLSDEQGFALFLAVGSFWQGWALVEQGQGEDGIAKMHQGLAAWNATGTRLKRPYYLTLLAEAYGKTGQIEKGLTVLAEALAVVDKNGERYYEAELYRLKGELTLQSKVQGPKSKVNIPQSAFRNPQLEAEAEAEACFFKAIEIARHQQAKSLELRAVVSLSRLWQQQGKKKEAHEMLAEVYGWFTEGFDTKDLQEAKALLEELNH